jgi:hypothetical protein
MFKRGIAVLVPVLLLVLPAVAGASPAANSHTVKLAGLIDTVSSKGATGVQGSTETDAGISTGTISGKPTGTSAFYLHAIWGSGLKLTGNGTAFYAVGSVRFKLAAKFAPASGGGFTYTGTITVTGGTGAFKRAHGSLGTSGTTLPSDPDAATINATGTLKY